MGRRVTLERCREGATAEVVQSCNA